MNKTAALFSGQGSQFPGMGKDLYDAFPKVRQIYECAGDVLGMDIAKLSFEGDVAELARTIVAQPAIYTMSISAFEAAKESFPHPAAVAGHSLGEYAALYAAGAFSLEDGFRIIHARGKSMEEASGKAAGSMWAIMKSDEETIETACREVEGLVMAVNFNNPGQIVISGESEAADKAAELLKEKGAKAAKLGVASAFHTPLMQPAADLFLAGIQGIPFSPCTTPFYSNLTGDLLEIDDYPSYLVKHMLSPVLFYHEIGAMAKQGVDSCIEFGPKKTVATMAKKTVKEWKVTSVENCKTLEGLAEFFAK